MPRCEGNGLFTRTLLNGLNHNSKPDLNAGRVVSMFELGKYARDATKAIAQRVKHAQEPLIINVGQDTPVYRLP